MLRGRPESGPVSKAQVLRAGRRGVPYRIAVQLARRLACTDGASRPGEVCHLRKAAVRAARFGNTVAMRNRENASLPGDYRRLAGGTATAIGSEVDQGECDAGQIPMMQVHGGGRARTTPDKGLNGGWPAGRLAVGTVSFAAPWPGSEWVGSR